MVRGKRVLPVNSDMSFSRFDQCVPGGLQQICIYQGVAGEQVRRDTGLECQARAQKSRGRSRGVLGPSGCDQSCSEGMN